ncbi:hypothetical protein PRZ48_010089 [Zasmidium cellare]|uniref:Uncharacterized protein n=1 Tax=Zasmidium cellare TaxID=395010 RepID=A0ABR0EDM1_ZASCE|nr:hypothetical protein PRZ48_010089 [Zasmidium cellare]
MRRRAAQPEGILTTSGLLYEGNFTEWQRRISAGFVFKGKPELAYPSIEYTDPSTGRPVYNNEHIVWDIESPISQVSPALLSRIQSPEDLSMGQLYARLEALCTPFRLMDLPVAVRKRIWKQIIEEGRRDALRSRNETWVIEASHRVPALMGVSRQLRQEVLPLYFTNCTFSLNAEVTEKQVWSSTGYYRTIRGRLERWANVFVGPSSAPYLRRFKLGVGCQRKTLDKSTGERYEDVVMVDIELSFSAGEGGGLKFRYPDNLCWASKAKIEALVTRVKGRGMGGTGQSILTAIREGGAVWHYIHLRLRDE